MKIKIFFPLIFSIWLLAACQESNKQTVDLPINTEAIPEATAINPAQMQNLNRPLLPYRHIHQPLSKHPASSMFPLIILKARLCYAVL